MNMGSRLETKLFGILQACFSENFPKVTHPKTTSSQARLTIELL